MVNIVPYLGLSITLESSEITKTSYLKFIPNLGYMRKSLKIIYYPTPIL